jgi:hypothetical protein
VLLMQMLLLLLLLMLMMRLQTHFCAYSGLRSNPPASRNIRKLV